MLDDPVDSWQPRREMRHLRQAETVHVRQINTSLPQPRDPRHGVAFCALHAQQLPELGPAPRLQVDAVPQRLAQPQPVAPAAVSFNPLNRNEVALAYQNIFVPQLVPSGWNGNVGSCNPGTTSAAYHQATIDRVNYFRVQAGLPGNVTILNGSEPAGTQAAALIYSAQQQLSHSPPTNWACWTQAGYDAAAKSNIALSYGSDTAAGPNAMVMYMDDAGAYNDVAGHRRWLLYPPQTQMASGSIPYGPQWAANALWILGPFGARPATPNGVAWPPRGYVPWQLLPQHSNRWSFSWNGANFSAASVSMTRNGVPLGAPSYGPVANGYGDNTLVWLPQGVTYVQPAADVTYHVTISGISGGGAPSTISYDVIVIDPYAPGDLIFDNGFD